MNFEIGLPCLPLEYGVSSTFFFAMRNPFTLLSQPYYVLLLFACSLAVAQRMFPIS